MRRVILIVPAALGWFVLSPAIAANLNLQGIRGPAALTVDPAPPPLASADIEPDRQPRIAHDQPPVIPHAIRGYRITARANRCLSCHGRDRAVQSAAPKISIAHLIDRDRRVHASIDPGHYFCTGCHVPQAAVSPPVGNTFHVLATVPFRRFVCLECHLPQIGISPKPGPALPEGNGRAH